MISSRTTPTTTNAELVERFRNLRAGAGFAPSNGSTATSALTSANSAMSDMTSLMARVRVLDRQAGLMSASNPGAIEAMRKEVGIVLSKFDDISKKYGTDPEALKSDKEKSSTDRSNVQSMSLDQLRKTLGDMNTNLGENVKKVGVAMQKAVLSGATMNAAPTFGFGTQNPSDAWATMWANVNAQRFGKYL